VPASVGTAGAVAGAVEEVVFAGGAFAAAVGSNGSLAAVEGIVAAAPVSKTERFSRPPMIVKPTDVHMKIAARAKVVFVKKFAPPELPKTVLLEPPRVALISAPFPDCMRTTTTIKKQVTIWTTVTKVVIGPGFKSKGG
jgi:hypothetical protein